MRRSLSTLFILVLVLPACTTAGPDDVGPGVPGAFTVFGDEPGVWWTGDAHVHTFHSTDAATESTPERIRATALERGLGWVMLADHSNATGSRHLCLDDPDPNLCVERFPNRGPEFPLWTTAAALSSAGFLMLDGNEASPVDLEGLAPRGHVGILPRGPDFDRDWVIYDRPSGAVTGGWAIAAAHRHGALAILHHPFSPGGAASWTEYDWTSFDYDGMEVYNGGAGYDDGDRAGVAALWCDWLAGRPVAAFGSSDNHRIRIEAPGDLLNPALGDARTSVLVAETTWADLIAGVAARRTVAHDADAFLAFRVADGHGRWWWPGAEVPVATTTTVTVEIVGWSTSGGEVAVYLLTPGACRDPRVDTGASASRPTLAVEPSWRLALPPDGRRGSWRRELTVAPGQVLALAIERSWPLLLGRGAAIPTPVRFVATAAAGL